MWLFNYFRAVGYKNYSRRDIINENMKLVELVPFPPLGPRCRENVNVCLYRIERDKLLFPELYLFVNFVKTLPSPRKKKLQANHTRKRKTRDEIWETCLFHSFFGANTFHGGWKFHSLVTTQAIVSHMKFWLSALEKKMT